MKITRSTFVRKALTFGIIVFMSVALVVSGFAAWLISSGSKTEGTGNVKVETVSHADIQINIDNLAENGSLPAGTEINFAPFSKDNTGYIQYSDGLAEKLSFQVTGNVINGDKVGKLSFSLKVSDGVAYAAGFSKSKDGWRYDATKAYIHLPSYAMDKHGNTLPNIVKSEDGTFTENDVTAPVVLTVGNDKVVNVSDKTTNFNYKYNSTSGKYEITATYVFGWGPAVNGDNPGITLDSAQTNVVVPNGYEGTDGIKRAELTIRLINAILSEQNVGTQNAYEIDPLDSTLDLDATIATLKELETNKKLNGGSYTVVIEAMPK